MLSLITYVNGNNRVGRVSGDVDIHIATSIHLKDVSSAAVTGGVPADDVTIGACRHARLQGHAHVRLLVVECDEGLATSREGNLPSTIGPPETNKRCGDLTINMNCYIRLLPYMRNRRMVAYQ